MQPKINIFIFMEYFWATCYKSCI